MMYHGCQNQMTSNYVPSNNIHRKVRTKISTVHLKQNQGKSLYYEMRMPRKLLFQVSYFSHCVYTFDTDSSEGNLQNTYCIKMFENFFMCYSIFGIILLHIFRNAQH